MSQGIFPKFISVRHFLDYKRGMEMAQSVMDLRAVNAFGSCQGDVLRTRQSWKYSACVQGLAQQDRRCPLSIAYVGYALVSSLCACLAGDADKGEIPWARFQCFEQIAECLR